MPPYELLVIALRVLSDVLVHHRAAAPEDVRALKAADPEHEGGIDDLACDIIQRVLAERNAVGARDAHSARVG
jgi:hypothetical protein